MTIRIDKERFEVRVHGKSVILTCREFDILSALVEAKGKVLSRDNIIKIVWGENGLYDISSRMVDQHVARMRRKLKSRRAILTVTGRGYRFIGA